MCVMFEREEKSGSLSDSSTFPAASHCVCVDCGGEEEVAGCSGVSRSTSGTTTPAPPSRLADTDADAAARLAGVRGLEA